MNKLSKPDIVVNETVKEITSLRKHPNAEQTANAIMQVSNSSDRQKENDKKRSANNILSKYNKSENDTSSKKDNKINRNEITLVKVVIIIIEVMKEKMTTIHLQKKKSKLKNPLLIKKAKFSY